MVNSFQHYFKHLSYKYYKSVPPTVSCTWQWPSSQRGTVSPGFQQRSLWILTSLGNIWAYQMDPETPRTGI